MKIDLSRLPDEDRYEFLLQAANKEIAELKMRLILETARADAAERDAKTIDNVSCTVPIRVADGHD